MPTPTKGPRLGGGPAHERLMLANLATSLFEHRRITTTEAKAKRLRPLAERMVTFAKRGDLHARRRVMTVIRDKTVVHLLFTEIAPLMADRQGGYTRITKLGPRKGDNAPMAVIELVVEPLSARQATVREAESATRRASRRSAPAAAGGATARDSVAGTTPAGAAAIEESASTDAESVADADVVSAAEVGDVSADAPYGPDSAGALEGGAAPDGFAIKGNANSMKYHTSDSPYFDNTVAEVWFRTEEAAVAGA